MSGWLFLIVVTFSLSLVLSLFRLSSLLFNIYLSRTARALLSLYLSLSVSLSLALSPLSRTFSMRVLTSWFSGS